LGILKKGRLRAKSKPFIRKVRTRKKSELQDETHKAHFCRLCGSRFHSVKDWDWRAVGLAYEIDKKGSGGGAVRINKRPPGQAASREGKGLIRFHHENDLLIRRDVWAGVNIVPVIQPANWRAAATVVAMLVAVGGAVTVTIRCCVDMGGRTSFLRKLKRMTCAHRELIYQVRSASGAIAKRPACRNVIGCVPTNDKPFKGINLKILTDS
jgi:hypothetical protein